MRELSSFSDQDFRQTILRALRLLAVLALLALPIFWWKQGWHSAAGLLIGAAISASGLWEWLRLLTVIMQRMVGGEKARPVGTVLAGFFLRLIVVLAVLYGSLRFLEGSVVALAAGLGLGVFALTVEGIRLVKSWTM